MITDLSPRAKRNIARIFPFALIWLVTGWIFMLVEIAATGSLKAQYDEAISLNLMVFVFASTALLAVGLVVGALEMIWLEDLFGKKSFTKKILYKLGLYTVLFLLIITITYPVAASMELKTSILDPRVLDRFLAFLFSVPFLSTLLQMSFSLLLCLFYAGISENLGHGVLTNFFKGKYHQPKEEQRIFMFLDMKSSTMVAEQLGHFKYFQLLREYYDDMSKAIINHGGEVYQYIGDEVVITWETRVGLDNNNCLNCFFAMKADLESRQDYYKSEFGLIPSFKAGLHYGKVTTGEIGALKKEIAFSGDVLNVTARIQELCNHYDAELIISESLVSLLKSKETITLKSLGTINLKGRVEPLNLYAVG
ncbi:MAG: adenylate/guanylate cyclase domain-containing protein [Cyclobacteriaceae bacterium]|nr:adenylate/guanylate cyclase domain-containing protein [Cyclobacteriaceae bacterium]